METIYLEIADISSTTEEYIKFRTYNSIGDGEADKEELSPLSNYYYEALELCISNPSAQLIKIIDMAIDAINKAWIICNNNNKDTIIEAVKKISDTIKKIIIKDKKSNMLISLEFNNEQISELYSSFEAIESSYFKCASEKIIKIFNSIYHGCVALAMPICNKLRNKDNCYLSLSGAKKDYYGSIKTYRLMKKDINDAYSAINDLLYSVYNFNFIECHLTDDTRRYTYYDNRINFDRNKTDGRPLASPIKFIRDYPRMHNKKNFGAHYSCCEKKILAKMGFVNRDFKKLLEGKQIVNLLTCYEFKIKYEPCRMCRPALIGCYFIRFKNFKNGYQIKLNPSKYEPFILG